MATPRHRAVIITALPIERMAVSEHLRGVGEEPPLRGSIYRRGVFDDRSDAWDIILAEIGAGNEGAAAEAERVISHYHPQVAMFIGVAGGIKDLSHGDVVASTKVYNYEAGKDRSTHFERRPETELPAYSLLCRARHEAGEPHWRDRIRPSDPPFSSAATVKAIVGPIAAGPKVLASNRSATYEFLRNNYGDAVAVEMEGHGFLRSVRMNQPVQGIVIRGISDCISDKNPESDHDWQPIAARHAAAFAFQVLAKIAATAVEIDEDWQRQHMGQTGQDVAGLRLPSALLGGVAAPQAVHPPTLQPPSAAEVNLPIATRATLFAGQQPHAALAYVGPALVLDAPALQPWIARRRETVARLMRDVKKATWFSLYGTASRGKTLLARLLADAHGGSITWLSFAGQGDDGSAFLLERLCISVTRQPPPLRREQWYKMTCQVLGHGAVLVLDDLPNLAATPQLRARLEPIVRGCSEVGVRIISTSLFPIPTAVLQALEGDVIDEPAPLFTDSDAEEVLKAFNAPPGIVKSVAKLINLVARQHPTLFVAACRYLEMLDWKLEGEGLQGLFQGAHTSDLAEEVHQKLRATIPDGITRQLLYRLSLIAGPFSGDDLDALAGSPPPIDRARERLRDITNSWVDQRSDDQWVVSALLGNMGRDNLSGAVRQGCHLALAEAIARRGMNQHTAFLAITHFHQGGNLGKAAVILIMILQKATKHAEWIADDALLLLWTSTPLPDEMDLNLRLVIRGLHISLFHKLGKPLDFLFQDLESLLSQATAVHRIGAAGAVSLVITVVGRHYPIECGRWLRRFLTLPDPGARTAGRPKRKNAKHDELLLPDEFPLHFLIWMLIGELSTAGHISDWLNTVEALPADVRRNAFEIEAVDVQCVVVAESLKGAEQAKPQESRDWPTVVAALTEFAARARALGVEVLWAAFIRAKITAQAEFCRDVDEALATATEAAGAVSVDPIVRFMISGTIGRELLLAKRYADARFWLKRAVSYKADAVFAYERMNVLLGASHALGLEDAKLGLDYAKQATTLAESDAGVPVIDRIRAWSELGVAQFLANGAREAFSSWDRAGEYLFTMSERNDSWKELMVLFGHTSGYLAKVAETGSPPTLTLGGEHYAPPERGIFMTTNSARVAFFQERNEGGLWRILGYFAEAVGDSERATKWKTRAAEVGKRDSFLALVAEADREEIPKLIREKDYLAALKTGRQSAEAMVVSLHESKAGRNGIVPPAEMSAALAELSDAEKLAMEDFGMMIGLIPSILSVATSAINPEFQETSKAEAEQVVAACRAIGRDSLAAEKWDRMAELVERAYVLDHTATQIADWSKTFTEPMPESLKLLVRLAASANATPTEAVGSMLSVMPRLCACYPPKTSLYEKILLPFVVGYWTYRFAHQRFLFGNAMVIESELPKALATPESERVVSVFRALYAGFRFSGKMPDDVRKWLFG